MQRPGAPAAFLTQNRLAHHPKKRPVGAPIEIHRQNALFGRSEAFFKRHSWQVQPMMRSLRRSRAKSRPLSPQTHLAQLLTTAQVS
jgi:hypothetical protein